MSEHPVRIHITPEGIRCGTCEEPVRWVRPCDTTCRCDSFVGGWQHVEPDSVALAASMARHPAGKDLR